MRSKACDSSCKTCSGPAETNCLSCNSPSYFYMSACYSECPNKTYPSVHPTTNISVCLGNDYPEFCFNNDIFYLNIACDSSCATCTAGLNTSCVTCPSTRYFTSSLRTCTSTCSPPYTAITESKTCMIVNTDTSTLNQQLSQILSDLSTPTVSSPCSPIQDFGSSLKSIGDSIVSYENSNIATDSSPCPQCSSNGQCQQSELYLKELCICNDGWVGDSCSISVVDSQNLEDITLKVLKKIGTVSSCLRLTVDAQSQDFLQTILNMLTKPVVTSKIVTEALSIIKRIVDQDYAIKGDSDVFDPVKMTVAAQIVNKCMRFVYNTDCFLQQASAQGIYSDSTKILDELGSLQLWKKPVDSGSYSLETDDFEVYSNRVSASALPSTVISIQNQPKIVLGGGDSSSSSNTAPVDLRVVFWKTNLFSCPQTQKQNATVTPVSIAISDVDSTTPSPAASSISAQISYPITSDSSPNLSCASGCTGKVVPDSSGQSFFQCSCDSVSTLSSNNQLLSVFTSSNAYKLFMAGALAGYQYLSSWTFWLLLGLASWYILTMVCIRAKIISPLMFLGDRRKVNTFQLPTSISRIRLKLPFCKSIYYGLKVISLITILSY